MPGPGAALGTPGSVPVREFLEIDTPYRETVAEARTPRVIECSRIHRSSLRSSLSRRTNDLMRSSSKSLREADDQELAEITAIRHRAAGDPEDHLHPAAGTSRTGCR